MIQVNPSQRPNCDKILEMPIVRKKAERLFPQDFLWDQETPCHLLNTIRVPKNLLYLTDRLPKPNYDSDEQKRREMEELHRRRTHEGSQMLPELGSTSTSPERGL